MKVFIVLLLIITAGAYYYFQIYNNGKIKENIPKEEIIYVPLGDSYTIGEGVGEEDRFPNQLVTNLKKDGFNIIIPANPAISGRTSADVLNRQLAVLGNSKANFTTLLIGANDIVQGVSASRFKNNIELILEKLLTIMSKDRIIILTIPDFSVTPAGSQFARGTLAQTIIFQFNKILKEEADKKDIAVIDILDISKKMADNPTLIISDGLHPSKIEYKEWEKLLYPKAIELLTKQ